MQTLTTNQATIINSLRCAYNTKRKAINALKRTCEELIYICKHFEEYNKTGRAFVMYLGENYSPKRQYDINKERLDYQFVLMALKNGLVEY